MVEGRNLRRLGVGFHFYRPPLILLGKPPRLIASLLEITTQLRVHLTAHLQVPEHVILEGLRVERDLLLFLVRRGNGASAFAAEKDEEAVKRSPMTTAELRPGARLRDVCKLESVRTHYVYGIRSDVLNRLSGPDQGCTSAQWRGRAKWLALGSGRRRSACRSTSSRSPRPGPTHTKSGAFFQRRSSTACAAPSWSGCFDVHRVHAWRRCAGCRPRPRTASSMAASTSSKTETRRTRISCSVQTRGRARWARAPHNRRTGDREWSGRCRLANIRSVLADEVAVEDRVLASLLPPYLDHQLHECWSHLTRGVQLESARIRAHRVQEARFPRPLR